MGVGIGAGGAADRMLEPSIETMDRAALVSYQEQRLLETLDYVSVHSPFFADMWSGAGMEAATISSMAEFRHRVPLVDKAAIRRFRESHHDALGGLRRMEHVATLSSSTGTTGDPLVLPSGHGYGALDGGGLARDWWEIGVRPGDAVAFMLFTFRGPAWLTPHALGASCVLFDHHPAEFARWIRASLELRPTLLYLLSGPLVMALAYMEEAGMLSADLTDVFASYEGIIIGGEHLGIAARSDLERWGAQPFLHTAVGDVGSATECREHDGLHFSEDAILVEILDPRGTEPVAEGEVGELVATTLLPRNGNPLVRYRSEDLVRASTQPCRCGRTGMRLWPVGRKGDEVMVEGRPVLPLDIWRVIESVPECRAGYFQIIRTAAEMPVLRLRIGRDPASSDRNGPAIRSDLVDAVASELGVAPEVELVDNEELLRQGPPHKIPRVVTS